MKNLSKRILTGVLAAVFLIAIVAQAAEPGSAEDPFISKSYVDTSLMPYINKVSSFTVVNLAQGQMLIGDAGCEIILRMGSATVISTEKGGICDVTIGGDWPNGSPVPANHNLIVPLGDGRGVKAETDIILMVKGNYTMY
ncbi:MAG: hypothetical protein IJ297_03855 [Clostridia bacterium]|nr:hypothetical protein [Clostridia bacterium]